MALNTTICSVNVDPSNLRIKKYAMKMTKKCGFVKLLPSVPNSVREDEGFPQCLHGV